MNSFIETWNQWGGYFLNFAWPMLWQSSLLIIGLFAFDLLFRRRIRASVRYALWLVVLIKLCLPPTLALPTSPVWWLYKTEPAVAANLHYTVTYDAQPMSVNLQNPPAVIAPPKPTLTISAGLAITSAFVSAILLIWLAARWWQIARRVRRAIVSERLTMLVIELQKRIGAKSVVPVKLSANSMSPAVCGLFRPAILIPETLADSFSEDQLHAVLLHELIHLRRRDVWLNFLQTLLQIVYWWHPLVWLASARIRRVREEAVDDAVMLVLRDEAESYAPTLLEVAKLALNRPLASLGLVGILESRSALRQRIERLVNFHAPRKAGLTLASLLGIATFSAVAVPMGGSVGVTANQTSSASAVSTSSAIVQSTNPALILITSHIYHMRAAEFDRIVSGLKFHLARANSDPWWSATPETFDKLAETLKSSGLHPISSPRIQTSSGRPARLFFGNDTNSIDIKCAPVVSDDQIDLEVQVKAIDAKISHGVTNQFRAETWLKNHGGIVFRLTNVDGTGNSNTVVVTSVQLVANVVTGGGSPTSAAKNLTAMTFQLSQPIRRDKLEKKLVEAGIKIPATAFFYTDDGILMVQGSKEHLALVSGLVRQLNGYSTNEIKADSHDFTLQVLTDLSASTNLETRTFRVNPRVFMAAMQNISGLQTNSVSTMARSLFERLGINWEFPKGKTIFYNNKLGLLFVRATESDMGIAQQAIQALDYSPPQLHIKARFLEAPKNLLEGMNQVIGMTNQSGKLVGILDGKNEKSALQTLMLRSGVKVLAEPEVTTLSGRQTEIRATYFVTIVTNFAFQETSNTSAIVPQTREVAAGPVLDTEARVLPGGYTIDLSTTASVTDFLGYDQPTNKTAAYNKAGQKIDLPTVLPCLCVRKASAHVKLWDGQTVMLAGLKKQFYDGGKEVGVEPNYFVKTDATGKHPVEAGKEVLVFITVTLVDSAGNRIHSNAEMSLARNGIPPQ